MTEQRFLNDTLIVDSSYGGIMAAQATLGAAAIGAASSGSYAQFETSTGFHAMYGDAQAWEDLRIPLTTVKIGAANAPDFTICANNEATAPSFGVGAYLFDGAANEHVYFHAQMPHAWLIGSTIQAHVHWCPTLDTAGSAMIGLEYAWAGKGGSWSSTTEVVAEATSSAVPLQHQATNICEITPPAGATLSSMLICRLFRDATNGSDTLDQDIIITEIDFHFKKDAHGSRTMTSK